MFSGVFAPMDAPLVKGGTVCTTVSKRKLEGGFPQRVTDGTNPRNIKNLIISFSSSPTTVVPRLACGLGHARGLTAIPWLSFKTLAPLRYPLGKVVGFVLT